MKTKLYILIIFSGLSLLFNIAFGQCTPDPNCTDPEGDGEFCPTEFPNAVESEYYEQTLTIIMPTQVQGINIHHIDLLNINNIPPGMNYQCQNNNCSFFPNTAKCVNVYGTPEIGSWGSYTLYLSLEVFIDVAGFPVSIGEISDSSSMVTIEPYLHADFMIDDFSGNLICYGNIYQVTYSGNASEAANYNWDFGQNLTVVSGEGAGPYEIVYEGDYYDGLDSISLSVTEGEFISPIFKETYLVSICESTQENEKLSVNMYPNPFHDYLHIRNQNQEINEMIISEISGEIVYQSQLPPNDNIDVNLSHLQNGIYFITVIGRETTKSVKIIKQ